MIDVHWLGCAFGDDLYDWKARLISFGANLLGIFPVFACDMIRKSNWVAKIAAFGLAFGAAGADGSNVFIDIDEEGGADDGRWSVAEVFTDAVAGTAVAFDSVFRVERVKRNVSATYAVRHRLAANALAIILGDIHVVL